ncbi:4-(cytidine 5'-diphospho)-2-C-methyl-D-erythritol kinase [Coralloluteibacterium stylophorae]|uniref:4-diphosphocytidyl-2-C-methyl-D-erythritol kinase n=1 Tax=Coralloluteibacterium stylophorae TaxID=1776034 RepID=A0AAP2CA42_9GAMM|nr:4-(cytidine 5'-diphospho)-2-C-methyl-D-erythritol kinase [Coralloluteibacterium stylophorae]MBS7456620.1 4-(cytidine 5'-diphospho)-2-C-methyl-D-erythritol kinase [Coralloluteibacterium stylophorae]
MPTFPPADGWSAWPAPAKLNLFLRIVGRRGDGYHLLQTVFRILEWGDRVHLRVRDDGRIERHAGLPGLAAEDDLVVRAARLLQAESGCVLGADVAVDKRIPAGGGFGGGSSDAATVLVVLDRLWGTRLGIERLAALGLRLGADVPAFVRGGDAWAEGVGERLVQVALAPRWYLVADPGVGAPTAALFADPELTRNAPPATLSDFVSGTVLDNAFEPVLRRREPAVDAALTALSRFGTARLTGTGAGCFVEFDTEAAATAAQRALAGTLRTVVTRAAEGSPLHRRLAMHTGLEARGETQAIRHPEGT